MKETKINKHLRYEKCMINVRNVSKKCPMSALNQKILFKIKDTFEKGLTYFRDVYKKC